MTARERATEMMSRTEAINQTVMEDQPVWRQTRTRKLIAMIGMVQQPKLPMKLPRMTAE